MARRDRRNQTVTDVHNQSRTRQKEGYSDHEQTAFLIETKSRTTNKTLYNWILVIAVLLVFGIALFLVFQFQQSPSVSPPDFRVVEQGYSLMRLEVGKDDQLEFTQAGTLQIAEDGTLLLGKIEEPRYPWEKADLVQSAQKRWGAYSQQMTEVERAGRLPCGVIEYYGFYYLITSDEKGRNSFVYPLEKDKTVEPMGYSIFYKRALAYHRQHLDQVVSGGNGLDIP